jgi:hypothetical protein
MVNDEGRETIVVSTTDVAQNLFIFMKSAMKYDEIEICYKEKYAPTVAYMVFSLRKAFGWLEEERGEREITNKKCVHSANGLCSISKSQLRCTEQIRLVCNDYEQADKTPFKINYVILLKAGGIRGL